MSGAKTPDGFSLRRWSRRKLEAAREQAIEEPRATTVPVPEGPPAAGVPDAPVQPPVEAKAPLPPVESLTPQSDFTVFMQPDVDDGLKRQALKKLFTDPHFNVMDGLDIYIDDYTKPDPIPPSVLERLAQSGFVRGLGAPREVEPPPSSTPAVAASDAASPTGAIPEVPSDAAADATATSDAPSGAAKS
jgi:hypothetical protein